MHIKIIFIILFMLFFQGREEKVIAAPEPSEVEQIKYEAPIHLIGEVV